MLFIDTHIHIDGEEFEADRAEVVRHAQAAGAIAMLVPAIDLSSSKRVIGVCGGYPDFMFPMIGLHPEEVRGDYMEQLLAIRGLFDECPEAIIGIGEVGLDFYWSREFEKEQIAAFVWQVEWAAEVGLPLMIHCRKGMNEMVAVMRDYKKALHGGVFHCFTGNMREAEQLLDFDNFALGIGGVLTFKKSRLPETLAALPHDRIVVETDAPYMAPVPMRGKRNESAFIPYIINKMAECWQTSPEEVARLTTRNAINIFGAAKRCLESKLTLI